MTKPSLNTWLCLSYYMLIYLPFNIYSGYLLYRYQTKTFFVKRHITLCGATLISQLLLNGFHVFLSRYPVNCLLDCNNKISINIKYLLFAFSLDMVIMIPSIRFWLLFFNLKWSNIIVRCSWWQHFNEQQYHQETGSNFFLKYRKTCIGTFDLMSKWLIIFYIGFMFIRIIMVILFGWNVINFLSSLYMMITLVFAIIIACFAPKFDTLFIRKELNCQIIIWVIICTFFAMTGITGITRRHKSLQMVNTWISMIASTILTFMTVSYPVLILKQMDNTDQLQLELEITSNTSNSLQIEQQYLSWKKFVCQSRENFDEFMAHLSDEWNVESLCFIVEIIQFKEKHLNISSQNQTKININTKYDNNEESDNNIGYYLRFPQNVAPKSNIVHSTNHDIRQQIILLYKKYIVWDSQLAINVSYEAREAVKSIVNDIKYINNKKNEGSNDDYNILMFDDCLKEVGRLLDDSWFRFRGRAITNV